jgi:hypothetical protein
LADVIYLNVAQGHEDSSKYTFPLLDGLFTLKLLQSTRKGRQQQEAFRSLTENVQLFHPFLATGDTGDRVTLFKIWLCGLFGMDISIIWSKNTSNIC